MRVAIELLKGGTAPPAGLRVYLHGFGNKDCVSIGVDYPNLLVGDVHREDVTLSGLPDSASMVSVLGDLHPWKDSHTADPTVFHELLPEVGHALRESSVSGYAVGFPSSARLTTLYTIWVGSLHKVFDILLREVFMVSLRDLDEGTLDLTTDTTDIKRRRNGNGVIPGKLTRSYAKFKVALPRDTTPEAIVGRLGVAAEDVLGSPVSPLLTYTSEVFADRSLTSPQGPFVSGLGPHSPLGDRYYWCTSGKAASRLLQTVKKLPPSVQVPALRRGLPLLDPLGKLVACYAKAAPVLVTSVVDVNMWSKVYRCAPGTTIRDTSFLDRSELLRSVYARVRAWVAARTDVAVIVLLRILRLYGEEPTFLSSTAFDEVMAYVDGDTDSISPTLQASLVEWLNDYLAVSGFVDEATFTSDRRE